MDKQTVVHSYNGILFSDEKKWAIKPQNDMEETEMHIAKWKKPVWKGYFLYYSNYMTFWKDKTMQIVKILMVSEGLVWEMQILGWMVKLCCMIL